ncbi:MAG TPA: DUF547 domain-containing protein [Rhodothermales bacterium]|nr:DUF547 domain-containing protein [Rhodothermales bacterium]
MAPMLRDGLLAVALAGILAGAAFVPQSGFGQAPGPAPDCTERRPTFDHSAFDRLLSRHVSEDGLVDYAAFAASRTFEDYLDALDCANLETLSPQGRLALWINAYNAYTIALIIKHDERKSIRNINKTLGFIKGFGPWKEPIARVGRKAYTLDEIEHDIIRETFDEPRIHFALVCAAVSCPPLRREAYTGEWLDAQLTDQASRFLAHSPTQNRIDVHGTKVLLSPIFKWYREDFPEGNSALGQYLAQFYPAGPPRNLLLSGDFRIEYTEYDWSLNAE